MTEGSLGMRDAAAMSASPESTIVAGKTIESELVADLVQDFEELANSLGDPQPATNCFVTPAGTAPPTRKSTMTNLFETNSNLVSDSECLLDAQPPSAMVTLSNAELDSFQVETPLNLKQRERSSPLNSTDNQRVAAPSCKQPSASSPHSASQTSFSNHILGDISTFSLGSIAETSFATRGDLTEKNSEQLSGMISKIDSFNRSLLEKESFLSLAYEQVELLNSDLKLKQEKLMQREMSLKVLQHSMVNGTFRNSTQRAASKCVPPSETDTQIERVHRLERENKRLSISNRDLLSSNKTLKAQLAERAAIAEQTRQISSDLRTDLRHARGVAEQHKGVTSTLKAENVELKQNIEALREELSLEREKSARKRIVKPCFSKSTQTVEQKMGERSAFLPLLQLLLHHHQLYTSPQEAIQSQLKPNESCQSIDYVSDIASIAETVRQRSFDVVLSSLSHLLPTVNALNCEKYGDLQTLFYQFLLHFIEPEAVPSGSEERVQSFCLSAFPTIKSPPRLERDFYLTLICLNGFHRALVKSKTCRTEILNATQKLLEGTLERVSNGSDDQVCDVRKSFKHILLHSHATSMLVAYLTAHFHRLQATNAGSFRGLRTCTFLEASIAHLISAIFLQMVTARDMFGPPFLEQVIQSDRKGEWVSSILDFFLNAGSSAVGHPQDYSILENMCVVMQHISNSMPSFFSSGVCQQVIHLLGHLSELNDVRAPQKEFIILNLKSTLQNTGHGQHSLLNTETLDEFK